MEVLQRLLPIEVFFAHAFPQTYPHRILMFKTLNQNANDRNIRYANAAVGIEPR
jgi:hypothetical protein